MSWFTGQPQEVPKVNTKYRRIATPIPPPQAIPILEKLKQHEPRSMGGQPPIVWERAQGIQVYDAWGNIWLDWSSGVLVTNTGHAHPRVVQAIQQQVDRGLLHNYCFPSEIRSRLAEALSEVAPPTCKKVFLLTTGSEATECAIKLARNHGKTVGGNKKIGIVGFGNGFHGRTLGAQMAGGVTSQKEWIVNLDPAMFCAPYPDGFRQTDTSFEVFLDTVKKHNQSGDTVAGVMLETYQGGSASFAPVEYIQQLRKWCDQHKVVLIFDEVQAGFGRTGKMWGFEHYGVEPDLFCCGKGISSSLPISAVIGKQHLMDRFPPGSMTSTHSGSPLCAAAALANLKVIREEKLVENAAKMGAILESELKRLQKQFGPRIGAADARGLVGTMQIVKPGTTDPDSDTASSIVKACIERGLLMFAPVGVGGGTVKISPPLITPEEALRDGISVLEESIGQVFGGATR